MEQRQLKKPQLAALSVPNIAMAAFLFPTIVHLPPFYANEMGLGLAVVGGIFLFTKLFDVVTDPIFGAISDQTQTRWGRRRPWIIIALPIMLLCTYQLFFPPADAGATYLSFWLIVTYLGWTMMLLSHVSWASELSGEYHERSRIQSWIKAAGVLGNLGVLLIPALIEGAGGDRMDVINSMGWFILITMPIGVLIAVSVVPEYETKRKPKAGLRKTLSLVIANIPLRFLLAAALCKTLATATVAALLIFYLGHVLNLKDNISVLLLLYFGMAFLGIPIWLRISMKLGKHKTFAISAVLGICGTASLALAPADNLLFAAVAICGLGLNFGVLDILPRAIMSDVIDHDLEKTGVEYSGVFFGTLLTTVKLAAAIAVGLTYPLLELAEFNPQGENTAEALNWFRLIFAAIPIAAYSAIVPIMLYFPLDEKRQIELRAHISRQEG